MSRPVSAYTQAIRTLLTEHNGDLTHAAARPLLVQRGFEIAADPPSKSEDSSASVMAACEFDEKTIKALRKEIQQRTEFATESNNFNVVKHNWKLIQNSGQPSASRKPTTSRNRKARTAAGKTTVTKLGRKRNAVAGDPLEHIKSLGGLAVVQAKIADMKAEIENLEAAVESVLVLQKQLAEAA
jgi:hypothetical protein